MDLDVSLIATIPLKRELLDAAMGDGILTVSTDGLSCPSTTSASKTFDAADSRCEIQSTLDSCKPFAACMNKSNLSCIETTSGNTNAERSEHSKDSIGDKASLNTSLQISDSRTILASQRYDLLCVTSSIKSYVADSSESFDVVKQSGVEAVTDEQLPNLFESTGTVLDSSAICDEVLLTGADAIAKDKRTAVFQTEQCNVTLLASTQTETIRPRIEGVPVSASLGGEIVCSEICSILSTIEIETNQCASDRGITIDSDSKLLAANKNFENLNAEAPTKDVMSDGYVVTGKFERSAEDEHQLGKKIVSSVCTSAEVELSAAESTPADNLQVLQCSASELSSKTTLAVETRFSVESCDLAEKSPRYETVGNVSLTVNDAACATLSTDISNEGNSVDSISASKLSCVVRAHEAFVCCNASRTAESMCNVNSLQLVDASSHMTKSGFLYETHHLQKSTVSTPSTSVNVDGDCEKDSLSREVHEQERIDCSKASFSHRTARALDSPSTQILPFRSNFSQIIAGSISRDVSEVPSLSIVLPSVHGSDSLSDHLLTASETESVPVDLSLASVDEKQLSELNARSNRALRTSFIEVESTGNLDHNCSNLSEANSEGYVPSRGSSDTAAFCTEPTKHCDAVPNFAPNAISVSTSMGCDSFSLRVMDDINPATVSNLSHFGVEKSILGSYVYPPVSAISSGGQFSPMHMPVQQINPRISKVKKKKSIDDVVLLLDEHDVKSATLPNNLLSFNDVFLHHIRQADVATSRSGSDLVISVPDRPNETIDGAAAASLQDRSMAGFASGPKRQRKKQVQSKLAVNSHSRAVIGEPSVVVAENILPVLPPDVPVSVVSVGLMASESKLITASKPAAHSDGIAHSDCVVLSDGATEDAAVALSKAATKRKPRSPRRKGSVKCIPVSDAALDGAVTAMQAEETTQSVSQKCDAKKKVLAKRRSRSKGGDLTATADCSVVLEDKIEQMLLVEDKPATKPKSRGTKSSRAKSKQSKAMSLNSNDQPLDIVDQKSAENQASSMQGEQSGTVIAGSGKRKPSKPRKRLSSLSPLTTAEQPGLNRNEENVPASSINSSRSQVVRSSSKTKRSKKGKNVPELPVQIPLSLCSDQATPDVPNVVDVIYVVDASINDSLLCSGPINLSLKASPPRGRRKSPVANADALQRSVPEARLMASDPTEVVSTSKAKKSKCKTSDAPASGPEPSVIGQQPSSAEIKPKSRNAKSKKVRSPADCISEKVEELDTGMQKNADGACVDQPAGVESGNQPAQLDVKKAKPKRVYKSRAKSQQSISTGTGIIETALSGPDQCAILQGSYADNENIVNGVCLNQHAVETTADQSAQIDKPKTKPKRIYKPRPKLTSIEPHDSGAIVTMGSVPLSCGVLKESPLNDQQIVGECTVDQQTSESSVSQTAELVKQKAKPKRVYKSRAKSNLLKADIDAAAVAAAVITNAGLVPACPDALQMPGGQNIEHGVSADKLNEEPSAYQSQPRMQKPKPKRIYKSRAKLASHQLGDLTALAPSGSGPLNGSDSEYDSVRADEECKRILLETLSKIKSTKSKVVASKGKSKKVASDAASVPVVAVSVPSNKGKEEDDWGTRQLMETLAKMSGSVCSNINNQASEFTAITANAVMSPAAGTQADSNTSENASIHACALIANKDSVVTTGTDMSADVKSRSLLKIDQRDGVVDDNHTVETRTNPGDSEAQTDTDRPFACPRCAYRSRKKGQLRKHLGVHRVHGCAHCAFTGDSHAALDDHMRAAHPSRCGRRLCKKCHVLFVGDSLMAHEAACTGVKRGWECTVCTKRFKFVSAMRTHMRRWHGDRGQGHGGQGTGDQGHEGQGEAGSSEAQGDAARSECPASVDQTGVDVEESRLNEAPLCTNCADTSAVAVPNSGAECSASGRDRYGLASLSSRVQHDGCAAETDLHVNLSNGCQSGSCKKKGRRAKTSKKSAALLAESAELNLVAPQHAETNVIHSPETAALDVVTELPPSTGREIKSKRSAAAASKKFAATVLKCDHCMKSFRSQNSLNKHESAKHSLELAAAARAREAATVSLILRDALGRQPEPPSREPTGESPAKELPANESLTMELLAKESPTKESPNQLLEQSMETPSLVSGVSVSREDVTLGGSVVLRCPFAGCGKEFRKLLKLQRHAEKHASDEKRHGCDWPGCHKAFLYADNLASHRLQHTDPKPFPCRFCPVGYWQKCSLKAHELRVHGGPAAPATTSKESSEDAAHEWLVARAGPVSELRPSDEQGVHADAVVKRFEDELDRPVDLAQHRADRPLREAMGVVDVEGKAEDDDEDKAVRDVQAPRKNVRVPKKRKKDVAMAAALEVAGRTSDEVIPSKRTHIDGGVEPDKKLSKRKKKVAKSKRKMATDEIFTSKTEMITAEHSGKSKMGVDEISSETKMATDQVSRVEDSVNTVADKMSNKKKKMVVAASETQIATSEISRKDAIEDIDEDTIENVPEVFDINETIETPVKKKTARRGHSPGRRKKSKASLIGRRKANRQKICRKKPEVEKMKDPVETEVATETDDILIVQDIFGKKKRTPQVKGGRTEKRQSGKKKRLTSVVAETAEIAAGSVDATIANVVAGNFLGVSWQKQEVEKEDSESKPPGSVFNKVAVPLASADSAPDGVTYHVTARGERTQQEAIRADTKRISVYEFCEDERDAIDTLSTSRRASKDVAFSRPSGVIAHYSPLSSATASNSPVPVAGDRTASDSPVPRAMERKPLKTYLKPRIAVDARFHLSKLEDALKRGKKVSERQEASVSSPDASSTSKIKKRRNTVAALLDSAILKKKRCAEECDSAPTKNIAGAIVETVEKLNVKVTKKGKFKISKVKTFALEKLDDQGARKKSRRKTELEKLLAATDESNRTRRGLDDEAALSVSATRAIASNKPYSWKADSSYESQISDDELTEPEVAVVEKSSKKCKVKAKCKVQTAEKIHRSPKGKRASKKFELVDGIMVSLKRERKSRNNSKAEKKSGAGIVSTDSVTNALLLADEQPDQEGVVEVVSRIAKKREKQLLKPDIFDDDPCSRTSDQRNDAQAAGVSARRSFANPEGMNLIADRRVFAQAEQLDEIYRGSGSTEWCKQRTDDVERESRPYDHQGGRTVNLELERSHTHAHLTDPRELEFVNRHRETTASVPTAHTSYERSSDVYENQASVLSHEQSNFERDFEDVQPEGMSDVESSPTVGRRGEESASGSPGTTSAQGLSPPELSPQQTASYHCGASPYRVDARSNPSGSTRSSPVRDNSPPRVEYEQEREMRSRGESTDSMSYSHGVATQSYETDEGLNMYQAAPAVADQQLPLGYHRVQEQQQEQGQRHDDRHQSETVVPDSREFCGADKRLAEEEYIGGRYDSSQYGGGQPVMYRPQSPSPPAAPPAPRSSDRDLAPSRGNESSMFVYSDPMGSSSSIYPPGGGPGHYPHRPGTSSERHPLQSLEGLASGTDSPGGSVVSSAGYFDHGKYGGSGLPPSYAPNYPSDLSAGQDYARTGALLSPQHRGAPTASEISAPSRPPTAAFASDPFPFQYFPEPPGSSGGGGHLDLGGGQDQQRSLGGYMAAQQQQRVGADLFRRSTPSAALIAAPSPYESFLGSMKAAGLPGAAAAQGSSSNHGPQHWAGGPEDRGRPWAQTPATLDPAGAAPPRSHFSKSDYPTHAEHSSHSKRGAPSGGSTASAGPPADLMGFPGDAAVAPPAPPTDKYALASAYSLAYGSSGAPTGYHSRGLAAAPAGSQRSQLEDAYRHAAAAAQLSDYRTLQALPPDVYGAAMAMNPALTGHFDRYYYSARDAMYRSHQLGISPAAHFMQQGGGGGGGQYAGGERGGYGREAMYAAQPAYSFMGGGPAPGGDKQYLQGGGGGGGKGQGAAVPPGGEYLHGAAGDPTQDPYRRSVIYNMMPRYF